MNLYNGRRITSYHPIEFKNKFKIKCAQLGLATKKNITEARLSSAILEHALKYWDDDELLEIVENADNPELAS